MVRVALFRNENKVLLPLASVIWLTGVVLVAIEELSDESLGWLGNAAVVVVIVGVVYFVVSLVAAIADRKR